MIAYLLRSLAQAVVVMLAVAALAFAMFRFVGDPVANMVGQEASVAERAELAERLGLNDPFPIQFFHFVRDMARGEFGMSYRQGRPVRDLLAERVPATVELAFLSSLFALVFGIALGVYAAINRRGILANAAMSLSLIGVSLPTFLIGIGVPPSSAMRACIFGSAKAATSALFSTSIASGGVPFGAAMPYQTLAS